MKLKIPEDTFSHDVAHSKAVNTVFETEHNKTNSDMCTQQNQDQPAHLQSLISRPCYALLVGKSFLMQRAKTDQTAGRM